MGNIVLRYLAVLTLVLGVTCIARPVYSRSPPRLEMSDSVLSRLCQWDGQWYGLIATAGYSWSPDKMSSTAFFPLYPMAAALIRQTTGAPISVCLLSVSSLGFVLTLVLFKWYLHERGWKDHEAYILSAFAFFPTSFFMVMAYSETTFSVFVILALISYQRRWPLFWSALIVGFATAARPVGVVLLPSLAWRCWREFGPGSRFEGGSKHSESRRDSEGAVTGSNRATSPQRVKSADYRTAVLRFVLSASWTLPLSCTGLIAYMALQWWSFGTPLAFAQTQSHWRMRPDLPTIDHVAGLVTLEPIWSVYLPGSEAYWQDIDRTCPCGLISLQAGNPVLFMVAINAVIMGWRRQWLNAAELQMTAGLLLIPYLTRSYAMCMASQGRFVLVALPVFMVLGKTLHLMPSWARFAYFSTSIAFLVAYTYSWAVGHLVI